MFPGLAGISGGACWKAPCCLPQFLGCGLYTFWATSVKTPVDFKMKSKSPLSYFCILTFISSGYYELRFCLEFRYIFFFCCASD